MFRGANQNSTTVGATSVTVTVGGYSIAAGDWMLLAANCGATGAKTFPSGFAAINGCTQLTPIAGGDATCTADVLAKQAVGGETSFVISGGNTRWSALLLVYSGRAAAPFAVSAAQTAVVAAHVSTISASFTGLTGNPGDDLVLIAPGSGHGTGGAVWTFGAPGAPPTGFSNVQAMTQVADFTPNLMSCDNQGYAGGATGTLTATITGEGAGTTMGYGGWLISLAGVSVGGGPILMGQSCL
jgi:hypothetical protein